MTEKQNTANLENVDFESALSKLETIVEKLGSEKVSLEEMVDLYQEGVSLKDHCSKKIADAKMQVDVILTQIRH